MRTRYIIHFQALFSHFMIHPDVIDAIKTYNSSWKPIKLAYDVINPDPEADDTLSPIILLHGLTSSKLTWKNLPRVIANATKRRVYALDARNHGESVWTDVFSTALMAKDVEHFMEENIIPKAIFIGHSMGGKTAMTLAMSKPEKVEKLITEDISPKSNPVQTRNVVDYIKLLRLSLTVVDKYTDLHAARKMMHEFIISKLPLEDRDEKFEENIYTTLATHRLDDGSIAWQANLEVLENTLSSSHPWTKQLEGVYAGDALFIYGTQSPFGVYKDKDYILKLFPKSLFVPIVGASHLVHLQFPEEYLRAIFDFI